jgi:small GTP-binding protein
MAEGKPREVKVVLLGDTGVGKSSLVLRFVTNNFKPYSESTIGASFMSKMIMVDGKPIKFQIWDTAGQEKYHSLAPMYYRGAAAAIIVYDITRSNTFKTLKNWVQELMSQGPPEIAIAIAGNKADLADQREVESSAATAYAQEIGAMYLETSAKDDLNVHDIFVQLSHRLPPPPEADANVIKAGSAFNKTEQQGSCC